MPENAYADANVLALTYAAGVAGDYYLDYGTGTLSVARRAIIVSANDASKVYGQTVTFAGTEFTASGLQNGERIGR